MNFTLKKYAHASMKCIITFVDNVVETVYVKIFRRDSYSPGVRKMFRTRRWGSV